MLSLKRFYSKVRRKPAYLKSRKRSVYQELLVLIRYVCEQVHQFYLRISEHSRLVVP